MMSLRTQVVNPYPPDYVDDGKIWAYMTVPEAGTYRISDGYGESIGWSALEIDGVNPGNTNRDQYLSEGDHLLKYTLSNSTIYPPFSRGLSSYFTLIIVPDTVTTLSDYCFYGAQNAYAKVLMDKTKITYLGTGGLFHANINFGDVDFPNLQTLKTFFNDYYAAGNCKIKSLGEITSIPDGGFRGSVFKDSKYIIPATVTSIGNLCYFQNNYNLIYYCYPTTPPTLGGSQVWSRAPAAIYVPSASVDTYKAAEGWSNYANKIQAM
jgi:hypothetical protein